MRPFERVWRRAFQPRASVPAVAPHQAAISLPETWEDTAFSSLGGMMTTANRRNSVACGVGGAPQGVPVEVDTSALEGASTTSSSLRTLGGTQRSKSEQRSKIMGWSPLAQGPCFPHIAPHDLSHCRVEPSRATAEKAWNSGLGRPYSPGGKLLGLERGFTHERLSSGILSSSTDFKILRAWRIGVQLKSRSVEFCRANHSHHWKHL